MDCSIYLNGVNVTNEIVEYKRQHSLCTGIGTITMFIKGTTAHNYSPGGTIVLYEGGYKMATYFINTMERQFQGNGSIVISGLDGSKLLQDFFIDDLYQTITIIEITYIFYFLEYLIILFSIKLNVVWKNLIMTL